MQDKRGKECREKAGETRRVPAAIAPAGVKFDRINDLPDAGSVEADNRQDYTRGEMVLTFFSGDMQRRYWESSVANVVEHGIGPARLSRADVDFDEIADNLLAGLPDRK